MKKSAFQTFKLCCLVFLVSICCISACTDDNTNGGSKDPEWTYDTGENPYGSKPCISGDKLIVCSRGEDTDLGTVHCLNLANGKGIWKMTDPAVVRNNPLVYNNLVIYGGYNFHALNLADGSHKWDFQDELVHLMLYSSPARNEGSIYTGAMFGFFKLDASNGDMLWKNSEGMYQNLALSEPAYNLGKLYFATLDGKVYSFNADTGAIEWSLSFEAGLNNTPLVTNDRIYIGIQAGDASKNSIFCYKLEDRSLVWSAKIWQVTSNMALDGGMLYVVGGSTLFCRSAATGAESWKYEMEAGSVGEPLVQDGRVYVGNGDNLVCLDAVNGKVEWSHRTSGGNGFGKLAISGDRLYAACEDGKVYCFKI